MTLIFGVCFILYLTHGFKRFFDQFQTFEITSEYERLAQVIAFWSYCSSFRLKS